MGLEPDPHGSVLNPATYEQMTLGIFPILHLSSLVLNKNKTSKNFIFIASIL